MNISFYLIPKSDVTYLEAEQTTSQALKLMQKRGYQSVPVIDQKGCYVGTISEGDFLWTLIREYDTNVKAMEQKTVGSYHLKWDYKAVSIDADMETLQSYIANQNFVPVVDGRNVFIGIVTRKAIISELIKTQKESD